MAVIPNPDPQVWRMILGDLGKQRTTGPQDARSQKPSLKPKPSAERTEEGAAPSFATPPPGTTPRRDQ